MYSVETNASYVYVIIWEQALFLFYADLWYQNVNKSGFYQLLKCFVNFTMLAMETVKIF